MDSYHGTAIQQYFSVYHSELISHTKFLGSNNLIKKQSVACFATTEPSVSCPMIESIEQNTFGITG